MIVSWKCDATRKRGSENIFDWSCLLFFREVFLLQPDYSNYILEILVLMIIINLICTLIFLAGWWDVGQLLFVSCLGYEEGGWVSRRKSEEQALGVYPHLITPDSCDINPTPSPHSEHPFCVFLYSSTFILMCSTR